MLDEVFELLEAHDSAEVRLAQARDDHSLAYALVMAALSWDQVSQKGWCTAATLGAQARRLAVAWGLPAEGAEDTERVAEALHWATLDPALLERDNQGRYRPVRAMSAPTGARRWGKHHRTAAVSGVLTPLERVVMGDNERAARPPDLDAAEASYQLALDSDDPDAAAFAALRLAEVAAEDRDQPQQAVHRYTEVAALRHPAASPAASLWLARRAALDGARPAARALAHEVLSSEDDSLHPEGWGLLASLAWLDEDKEAAVAAIRRAVDAAGEWHWSYSRRLAEMLIASGDLSGAADVYATLLDHPLSHGQDAARYVQLMTETHRLDEAVEVLERHCGAEGIFSGDMLLALASVHASRNDLDAFREVLRRVRAHWSAPLPQVSVRADMMEASMATAIGDDDRAAELYRSLTDPGQPERLERAHPLLIATGEHFAKDGKLCLIPGVRPLLEYLTTAASPETARWAATSLAHLAAMEDRPEDAETAIELAAPHMESHEVAVLRALLLERRGRGQEALTTLAEGCVVAPPAALVLLLATALALGMRGHWPDLEQQSQMRGAVDRILFPTTGTDTEYGAEGGDEGGDQGNDEGEGGNKDVRTQVAMMMAQVEMSCCFDSERAMALYRFVTDSAEPSIAASAWASLGVAQQYSSPISAAHAFEQAMFLDDGELGTHAAQELARLAERIRDNPVLVRACERTLDLTTGDAWAQAALRLGRVHHYRRPDDAELAYHAAIDEPGAQPDTIGTALAWLGALYAAHGNRKLAQRIWRRGKNHRDPHVAEAFATERAAIGRVRRFRRRITFSGFAPVR